jgi:hypothetical protein
LTRTGGPLPSKGETRSRGHVDSGGDKEEEEEDEEDEAKAAAEA